MIYNFDALEFKPITVGSYLHKDGYFDVKARPYASLSFRTKGEGVFEVQGKQINVTEGDILFMPSDTPYKAEYLSSESIVVHLEGCNYFEAEGIVLQNVRQIENCFGNLLTCWNDRHSVNQAKSIIYDILEKISENKTTVIGDTVFADCLTYINSHFCDPEVDIKKICEHGFISVSSLQRKFHEHFEMSPKQYLIKLRMNRAMELLIADELSVREIAFACGFSDEKYFSRAFKDRYGYPPLYMKKHILI
jgi:AraC-like DNA-binding protein